ncbi:hypothetical protein MMARJ_11000 [Mycobacterium marseillense]|uniref:Uncharacterized protein n=1 Tax=Mycobacterium marseillense TaxID=701042 RepID=A0ABM7J928_9MYCO|nr:hypothetical protein MMARJ_11000 [Mycobacterium marseillense]
MADGEPVVLVGTRTEQSEFDHRAGERHRRPLDRCRGLPDFPLGILRFGQVVEDQVDIVVIDRLLEDLAVGLEERGPQAFGLVDHVSHSLMQQTGVDRPVDTDQHAQLPRHVEVAGLLRQPDIELASRYRECPVTTTPH